MKASLHSNDATSRLDGVAPRSQMPNLLPRRALPGRRIAVLSATRGFTTGSYGNVRKDRNPNFIVAAAAHNATATSAYPENPGRSDE